LNGYFLSELVDKPVYAAHNHRLGSIWDLVLDLESPEPEVTRIVIRSGWSKERRGIDWRHIEDISAPKIKLKPHAPPAGAILTKKDTEILIKNFLYDKQIVDVNGAKVLRVNDIQFLLAKSKLFLTQVDVGIRGLLRRLGCERMVARFLRWFFDYELQNRFIAWHYAEPLADPARLRLQITQDRLASLHPADLADIMEDMDVHERSVVVASMSEEVIAEAIEEMDPKVQVSIMRTLDPDKAADIIEEMSPDEAADLIADLPKETVSTIFKELDDEYGETVMGLMEHDEDEAGGLMTTQYITASPDMPIVDLLSDIRKSAKEIDAIYYAYITDHDGHLMGVASLKDLLSNEIFTPVERIMTTRLVTADLEDSAAKLARVFAKYGFRALPVVDEDNRIKGVIRFKALLEILAPYLGR
jgi:CBS domain-containing protein/sporulation protein YlmC with PRC-barrel domain